jgi:hypothetical protein
MMWGYKGCHLMIKATHMEKTKVLNSQSLTCMHKTKTTYKSKYKLGKCTLDRGKFLFIIRHLLNWAYSVRVFREK